VRTGKAKSHIRRHIRREQTRESIRLGQEMAEKACRRLKMPQLIKQIPKDPQKHGYETADSLYAALGRGEITVRQVIEKMVPDLQSAEGAEEPAPRSFLSRRRKSALGVKVDGLSNLMVSLSKCCRPIPGDEIIGFVTRGRGVTVHRVSCSNLPTLEKGEDRYVHVDWDVRRNKNFTVEMKITAEDRKHLLKDLTETISKLNTNIASVDLVVDEGITTCHMVIEVDGIRQLERIQNRIRMVPGMIYLERV
jgi:GTP pyrophosphokinase